MNRPLLGCALALYLASVHGAQAAPQAPVVRAEGPATRMEQEQVIGYALREVGAPLGRLSDGPALELIHRAQLEATDADVSLVALPDSIAPIAHGRVTVADCARLVPDESTLEVIELTGSQLQETLEEAARSFAPYTYEDDWPVLAHGVARSSFDTAEGVTYEIDLTRPPGERVLHLSMRGTAVAPEQRLKVAVSSARLDTGPAVLRRAPRLTREPLRLREALVRHIRRLGTLDGSFERNWTVLPDYASTPERSLIDRLVRQGVVPRGEVHRLQPDEPGRRGDLAYWIARAFGWRERRLSGAYPDVPDSLEPWLDGLVRRNVIGLVGSAERFEPFRVVPLMQALNWCEGAARAAGYALASNLGDPSFRRGLTTGVTLAGTGGGFAYPETLTRVQMLAMVSNTRFPALRVLETADFHGALQAGTIESGSGRSVGGSAVLAAHLARLRAENPEGTVLLDGGDSFQGTMISNLAFGRPVVQQMNALGYSGWAIGNHEFDWGTDTLARRVHELHCSALAANLIVKASGRRPRWAKADTLLVRRGVRIAVFGLCYRGTPTATLGRNVAQLSFRDDSATAAVLVPALRRKSRPDAVVGLGHVPATMDSSGHVSGDLARLARGVRGVDLWLGGHSHTRVAAEVEGIPTLIPGSRGEAIAVCDLVVDPVAGKVVERRYRLQPTYADAVTPDSAMLALIERWNRDVAPLAAVPVGRNASRLTRSRTGESLVGNLVADATRSVAGADLALLNNGALRADLPEGTVTRSMIYELMPFEVTIVAMELTGAEVRRAIEEGLRHERLTQVSGLRYTFDLGAPEFARVVALSNADGTAFDESRTYRVTCNAFMAQGGDDYETLTRGRNLTDTMIPVRDRIEELIASRSRDGGALDYRPEQRIVRAPGSRPPARGD